MLTRVTYTPKLGFKNGTFEEDIAPADWANLRRTEKLAEFVNNLLCILGLHISALMQVDGTLRLYDEASSQKASGVVASVGSVLTYLKCGMSPPLLDPPDNSHSSKIGL